MNELALFAGAGGGILAGHSLGWRTVCAVEWESYAASVLAARQNDGILAPFPIWDDVQTFDGNPWRGIVDVVSGGFPCQDISVAGKGAGINGERSGMWQHMARIIGEVRPSFVFVENSPALLTRGLGRVLSDLASLGYDCQWTVLGAADVGAPHQRDRFWLVGHAECSRLEGQWGQPRESQVSEPWNASTLANPNKIGRNGRARTQREEGRSKSEDSSSDMANTNGMRELQPQGLICDERRWPGDKGWWHSEPDVGRVANGVAARVDRLKALGNGQVPSVAAAAIQGLTHNI